MVSIKKIFLKTLLLPGFPASFKYIQGQCATIFMLHRFNDPSRGVVGCDPQVLRVGLSYLVRNNYRFISLNDLFDLMAEGGMAPRGAVAFTIDDGYYDQAAIAAPVFAEFNCPVTTFVTTGFLDEKLWFWWDQIEFIFEKTKKTNLDIQLGQDALHYSLNTDAERYFSQIDFTEKCKLVSNEKKLLALKNLAEIAGIEVPEKAPPRCAPMTWDDLRECEKSGMTFGPHTINHPVLSRTTDEESFLEISGSWERLCEEATSPVPVFCYPNGQFPDFGSREIQALSRIGLKGAVVGESGYADAKIFNNSNDDRFKVRRFAYPDALAHMIQYVSGVEKFKQILRRQV